MTHKPGGNPFHPTACATCSSNGTHTVGDYTDYAISQRKSGKVFCNKLGWVVPCEYRQPSCGDEE